MATDLRNYITPHPGIEQVGPTSQRLMVDPAEGALAYQAANHIAAMEGKVPLLSFGGIVPYVSARVTETKDNSSTIAYEGAGLRFQTQATPSDNDDIAITSLETLTLAQDKVYAANIRLKVSSAANLGFYFGVMTSGTTDAFTTAPADGVYLAKAKNAATVVGRVIENGNAADDSGTLATMTDSTEVRLGFHFKAGSSAANSFGEWYVNDTRTAFTSAQVTAIRAMLATTAPTLSAVLHFRVNGTTQRNGHVAYALVSADR